MDIPSARLASLLKEAMTPQAVPSAKADPAKTALVKALLAPPAPSGVRPQPAAPALSALLPAVPLVTTAQQMPSAEIMQAYLAVAEPDTATEAVRVAAVARKPDVDDRGLSMATAKTEDAGPGRLPAMPWLAALPQQTAARRAVTGDAVAGRGQHVAQAPSTSADDNNAQRQLKIGLASLAVGALAMVAFGLALLVFG